MLSANSPSYRAMDSNRPVMFGRLDTETARAIDPPPRRPGVHNPLGVLPGRAADRARCGARHAGRSAGPAAARVRARRISPAADELASRAAVCIDNARLYDRERRSALALQQGLLPAESRVPAGLEVAAAVPAGRPERGRRRLARHRRAARRAGRADRRRRDGAWPGSGRRDGAVAHRRAHAGRAGPAARRGAAQARPDGGQPARRPVRHLRRGRWWTPRPAPA